MNEALKSLLATKNELFFALNYKTRPFPWKWQKAVSLLTRPKESTWKSWGIGIGVYDLGNPVK
jgi:hypothetical protein